MANEQNGLNGNTKLVYILLLMSLGLGGFSTLNSTGNSGQVEKLIESLDEVLQREMRLLTAPHAERLTELTDNQDNMRDRMNNLENTAAANRAYIERLQEDVERLKGSP